MNVADDNAIRTVMEKLRGFSFCSSLGIRDVMFDPATSVVAMIGPALTLERRLFPMGDNTDSNVNNYNNHLDVEWARLFGIPQDDQDLGLSALLGEPRAHGLSPQWWPGDGYGVHISDFLQSLQGAIADALNASGAATEYGHEDSVSCTITPEPGYPYTPGKTKTVYSARAKKWVKPPEPPYMTTVKNRDGKDELAVNWCVLAPVVCNQSGAMTANLDNIPMLLTHCVDLAGRKELHLGEQAMVKCPGLLFPSLAAGMIPATNFGETVLVVDPAVAVGAMKPYRKRGAWSAVTYSTDTWTETAMSMSGDIAIDAWDQLHGVPNWAYTNHFYILGPDIKETGFHDEAVKPITSTSKLASAMKRKFRLWERWIAPEEFIRLSEMNTGDRYGYLETKVNGIVGWDCIPLAAVPATLADEVRPMLKAMGFRGKVLAVDVPPDVAQGIHPQRQFEIKNSDIRNYMHYQWAWFAAEAILWEAGQQSKILQVELA